MPNRSFSPIVPKREGTDRWLYDCLRNLGWQTESLRKQVAQPPVVGPYWFKPGLPGGQLGYGGINTGENATIASTANATKGFIYLGTNFSVSVDETNKRVGLDFPLPVGVLDVAQDIPTPTTVIYRPTTDSNTLPGTFGNSSGSGHAIAQYISELNPDDSAYIFDSTQTASLGVTNAPHTASLPEPVIGVDKAVFYYRVKWTGSNPGTLGARVTWFLAGGGGNQIVLGQSPDLTTDALNTFVTYKVTLSPGQIAEVPASFWNNNITIGYNFAGAGGGYNGNVTTSWAQLQVVTTNAVNLTNWYDQTRTLFSSVSSDGYLGIGNKLLPPLGMLYIVSDLAGSILVYLQGSSNQSGNFLEVHDAVGNLLGAITPSGQWLQSGSTTTTFDNLSPLSVAGDMLYFNGTHNVRLAPNATGTKKFLTETSSVPSWQQIVAGDLPGYVAVDLTAQGADHSASSLGAGTGLYEITYYLETTTADGAAGTVTLQINITDDVGSTTQTSAALPLTATGRTSGSFVAYSGGVTYQTTHTGTYGTAKYALHLRAEFLG